MPPIGRRRSAPFVLAALASLFVFAAPAPAQDARLEQALATLDLREIGPALMGGRVADLAVDETDPRTFYVGFASGGLWKTTSHGRSWTPVFDDQPTASIGAVALAPSNPKVVWVGTGEPQNRQSSPYGGGVFRSLDGGDTWTALGLEETRHVARIVVHPRDPEIAWVAAVGHLFGPNPERGVYRTRDGGDSWERVLYVDENTGAIDLVMDPRDPNTLFAAMYQRRRTPWGFSADGDGSGLYRTLDGGETWVELTADGNGNVGSQDADAEGPPALNERGLPTGAVGRIGLDVYRRDGDLVYATIESRGERRGLYRSRDRGDTWERVSDRNPRPMYFSLVRIDPNDPERIYLGGTRLSISDDGGRSWRDGDGAEGIHVDHHALWINPHDSDHVILGNDGGVATSRDRGETWHHHDNLAVGQFYQVDVDMRDPYYVCGGLQDNSSWCGPSRTLSGPGIRNRDWYDIWGGDGFWNVPDPSDPLVVYTESQNGNVGRYHVDTGESQRVRPVARPTPDDTARDYRWNWNTPIHVSHHDPATVYVGANHLLRSRDRGRSWQEASPDLTREIDRDTLPIMAMTVDSTTPSRNDGTRNYGTIVEIGESPLDADVVYAGTDDGVLQRTRDGGGTWTDLTENVPDLEHGMVVSGIAPSRHAPGRVYLSFDGHWSDDYRPHVFVSENYGEDWRRITTGLPADASVNDVIEHPRTPDLLFLGNEAGAFVSVDRGASWARLSGDFPTVPVDQVVVHPRENDLVIGTHGRSIWILDDVAPLEQIARDDVLARDVHLFPAPTATLWSMAGGWPFWGDEFEGDNPPVGARIRYWLADGVATVASAGTGAGARSAAAERRRAAGDAASARYDGATDRADGTVASAAAGDGADRAASAAAGGHDAPDSPAEADDDTVEILIVDRGGEVVRTLEGPAEPGIQEVFWDFRMDPPYETDDDDGGWWGPPRGPLMPPGDYEARLVAAGDTLSTDVVVRQDPRIDAAPRALADRRSAALELYRLAAPIYYAGQSADEAEERIEAAKEVLSKSGEAAQQLLEEADSLTAALDSARERLDDAGPGRRLQRSIEGISEPPTADQRWQIDRAWERVPPAIEALNEIVTDRLAAFEAQVYQPAARPEPIEPVAVPDRP